MPDAVKPLPNHQCPLCGGSNQCLPTDTGSFCSGSNCWCKSRQFPPELLEKLNPEQRNQACICQRCVDDFHSQLHHLS
ncbi:cysteine-rich CWC family protein [Cellvibrio sp.]|uniref:cysteine-rich CWC family protein n=1 Tax=Cellvibrio sp. TaxID=1965322 RepID=UPI003F4BE173